MMQRTAYIGWICCAIWAANSAIESGTDHETFGLVSGCVGAVTAILILVTAR